MLFNLFVFLKNSKDPSVPFKDTNKITYHSYPILVSKYMVDMQHKNQEHYEYFHMTKY